MQLLGAILRILYGTFGTITPSEEFLCTCAGIFATNGLFFLVSSIMSVTTALMLPRQFYYTLFHLVAAVCYISGGVAAIGNSSIIDGGIATNLFNLLDLCRVGMLGEAAICFRREDAMATSNVERNPKVRRHKIGWPKLRLTLREDDSIVAIVCGVLHLAQFIYSLIKNW
ncbi:hypothetical protein HPB51_029359 [Rhipicephalus microplus]|uniref:Uncharacterized protein n=1 Tax=Rhipicephalus microplus TaxID=6941 RepID=A0A9J6CUE0_RHIMP|nr:hypothetical protein HPB51_029359 [Rhipicephalus microplus]